MIHKIALAAIFVQAAITAALATQIMLHDQGAERSPTDPLNLTAPGPVVEKQPIHTLLVLTPIGSGAPD